MARPPSFWQNGGILSVLLSPLSLVWRMAGWARHAATRRFKSDLPVICIGNITSGGTGKTPIVAALAEEARKKGWQPVILMRGHGGAAPGPMLVSPEADVEQTGDEARMLAGHCAVVISRDRAAGARFIAAESLGDLIIMDDGMQNPALFQDRLLVVFNGRTGLGNQRVIPAGPLRQTLSSGLSKADAAAISSGDECGITALIRQASPEMPILPVPRHLDKQSLADVEGRPAIAFSGIGDNEGFFNMLADAGVVLVDQIGFADHHPYSHADITALQTRARKENAVLITTEKDKARLGDAGEGIIAVTMNITLPQLLLDKILPRR